MIKNSHLDNLFEKKCLSRKDGDNFCIAEIDLSKTDLIYQLRLRGLNGNKASFLIKEDSSIFEKLKVGNILEMKYWISGKTKTTKFTRAKVKSITKRNQEPFKDHHLVVLSLSERRRSRYRRRSSLDQRSKQYQLDTITGGYLKEKLVDQVPPTDQQEKASDIADKDVQNFIPSIRKAYGGLASHYRLGLQFQKRNRHKNAIEVFKKVILDDTTYIKAYNAIGISYNYLGDCDSAINSYKLALKIKPNIDYVYNNLGYSYFIYGNYDMAIDAFQKAISLNDQNKRYYNNLGLAYTQKGQFELAFEQFINAGDEISANRKFAKLLYREGKFDQARKYQNKAIQLEASTDKAASFPNLSNKKISNSFPSEEENYSGFRSEADMSDSDQKSSQEKKAPASEYLPLARSPKKIKFLAEIEVLDRNGFEGLGRGLGNYLKKNGVNLTRLRNVNSFNRTESKAFYGRGQVEDPYRFMPEISYNPNTENVIELKELDNKIKHPNGKDMVTHKGLNSKSTKKGSLHPYSILLSSCRHWDKAQEFLINYQKIGLIPYFARVEPRKNEVWWRIFTGHYKTRQEALKIKNRRNLSESIVMKTPYTNLIGSFFAAIKATEMLHSIRKLGYSPYFVKTVEREFQLVVGAFQIKIRAAKLKLELESKGVQNKIIER
jgi:Flp pilus assembly protein TadD